MTNYVTLTFSVQDAGQDAETGQVSVQPTGVVTLAGTTVVSQDVVTRSFSGGSASVQLFASDNSGTTPAPGFWAYNITLPGWQAPRPYLINYANGSTQRFDSLTPVVPVTAYTSQGGPLYLPLAGGTMTGDLAPAVVTLTDAATVAVDADDGNDFRLTFTSAVGSSRTMGAPSNATDGQVIIFSLTQAASGGPYTVTWNSAYDFGNTGSAPTLTTTASLGDMVGFKYHASASGGNNKWWCTGAQALGF